MRVLQIEGYLYMRKEFKIVIIIFIITCVITVLSPTLYNGSSGIDGIGSALAYVLLIRLMQAILIVCAVTSIIIGVARKNNWNKKRTAIAAISPIIILIGIIIIPYATGKLKTELYLKTHQVQDLFSAKITNETWIDTQENDAIYLVLEYELANIKADYFEKFDYKLSEMFAPYMNEG
ncbi:hypothetical protein bhn_II078 (plasmid) [Butyrivibrio hungatei]|uniref:Uncharacterized protein n=2 Tax=Butyrivibrio hungatei TaxID=185008 RepID=A0A1D9P5M7_9FIRM|nr:hypothetical protein bhn_II078 [Butyrivibrio hungatei]